MLDGKGHLRFFGTWGGDVGQIASCVVSAGVHIAVKARRLDPWCFRFVEPSSDPTLDVYLVKVTPTVMRSLAQFKTAGFLGSFRLQNHHPTVALQPGDVVGVSIYEAGGSPLFGNSTGSTTTQLPSTAAQSTNLPGQLIEPDGQILIPFVGRVRIAGRTPTQAADEIARLLAPETVKPHVLVTVLNNNSNTVSYQRP